MESILTSIKKLLGIEEEYEHFDPDIIMHINSVFMILNQIGVGPSEGFSIEDAESMWTDFMPAGSNLQAVKSYIHHKVKLMFDPPSSSAHIEALNRTIAELEWRLNTQVESHPVENKTYEEITLLDRMYVDSAEEVQLPYTISSLLMTMFDKFRVVIEVLYGNTIDVVRSPMYLNGVWYIGSKALGDGEPIKPADDPFLVAWSTEHNVVILKMDALAVGNNSTNTLSYYVSLYGLKEG